MAAPGGAQRGLAVALAGDMAQPPEPEEGGSSSEPFPDSPIGRSRSLSQAHREIAELQMDNSRLIGMQRVVESQIQPEDLTATWEDREANWTDWRGRLVSGEHLKSAEAHGQGAQGEVYRAVWKSSIPVAIKESTKEIDSELTDEMQLFLDLHHPHVVACYGILKETVTCDEATGTATIKVKNSIVTERCRKPLNHFLSEHSEWEGLSSDEIDVRKYTILHHVSLGLQKLHDMGVLHRDIKGGNILLDGVPRTCRECEHAGKWKICDFGEAKVLKSPSLTFSPAVKWPKGWGADLCSTNRFQPITSPILRKEGARHYCWLLPGEELTPGTDGHASPPRHASETSPHCGRDHLHEERWVPCVHGGFVYSFNDDPLVYDQRNCFFEISGVSSSVDSAHQALFPTSLGPFGLSQTELLPVVNFEEGTYQLRSMLHQNPQLELLKNMMPEGANVEGKISLLRPITLSASDRRQAMIPADATHFAWAYQGVDLEDLSSEHSKQLETDSGEISFVSLGGFLYFQDVEESDDAEHTIVSGEVIRANAIGLGLGLKCRVGTIDRPDHDNNVTATIASPEIFEGRGIGLETDVFAFGVVMWEVFTRQEAWHWISKNKNLAIMTHVLLNGHRPKAPQGLSARCALMLRQCLHQDPNKRPTMREVTLWLDMCRRKLMDAMEYSQNEKLKECDFHPTGRRNVKKADKYNITIRGSNEWVIDSAFWSDGGRFSLNRCKANRSTLPRGFRLEIVECTQDQWMENALKKDEKEPVPFTKTLPKIFEIHLQNIGLVFKREDGKGGKEDLWQDGNVRVAQVNQTYVDKVNKVPRPTVASEYPEICPGSVLTRINGQAPPATIKEAMPMFRKRPLTLEFNGTVTQTVKGITVSAWLVAGLAEIELVRRYEASRHAVLNYDCKTCKKSSMVRSLSSGWKTLSGHSPRDRKVRAATRIQYARTCSPISYARFASISSTHVCAYMA